jgi:hypothetical protein
MARLEQRSAVPEIALQLLAGQKSFKIPASFGSHLKIADHN